MLLKFVAAVTWLMYLVVWSAANLIPLAIVRRLCLSYRLSHNARPSAYVYKQQYIVVSFFFNPATIPMYLYPWRPVIAELCLSVCVYYILCSFIMLK